MEDLPIALLWVLGYPVALLVVMAALGMVGYGCDVLTRLVARAPGPLGRVVRAWEQKDPGTPTGVVFVCVLLGFLVSFWTGLLGNLLIFSGIRG